MLMNIEEELIIRITRNLDKIYNVFQELRIERQHPTFIIN